jgi:hypothetical protein
VLATVGILSIGCATLYGPPPRAPGSPGLRDAPAPSAEALAPFSIEERERIAIVDPWVTKAATRYAIDADLIRGLIWVESRFEPRAKSPAGARGLMQLMPQTASGLAEQLGMSRPNPYDPEFNVTAGSYYLQGLLARYHGDVELALAAYNAGPGNVDRWGHAGLPPHSREYVRLVLEAKARFEAAHSTPIASDTVLVKAERREPPPIVIPEPPATAVTEDGTPVRWDLDRVETEYQVHAEDPPMGETPLPREDVVDDGDAIEIPEPTVGIGVLPSVED